jgi:hypothetical protein
VPRLEGGGLPEAWGPPTRRGREARLLTISGEPSGATLEGEGGAHKEGNGKPFAHPCCMCAIPAHRDCHLSVMGTCCSSIAGGVDPGNFIISIVQTPTLDGAEKRTLQVSISARSGFVPQYTFRLRYEVTT